MGRAEWTLMLSDENLKKYIKSTQNMERTGIISDEVREILDKQYNQFSYLERAATFCIDVWKEAAFRWIEEEGD